MTTTTRSSSNRNDGPNGLINAITDVISLPTSSSANPRTVVESSNLHHDELEDDVALEVAFAEEEEKFIDEEISSYDEDGRPIVDTEALEHRHLTVALVQSCVDQQQQQQQTSKGTQRIEQPQCESSSSSNSSPSSPTGDHRRYGLRPRSASSRLQSNTPSPVPVPGSRKRGRPPSSQNINGSNDAPIHQQSTTITSPPATSIIPNATPQLPKATSMVPNPLISPPISKPLQPPPSILLAANQTTAIPLSSIPTKNRIALTSSSVAASTSPSFSAAATTPLTSNRTVELRTTTTTPASTHVTFEDTPLSQSEPPPSTALTASLAPKTVAIEEPLATVAELPFLVPSQSAPTSRGRIFSIDFEPGFDFSDMALDLIQATDFGPQQQPQSLSAIPQHKDTSTTTTVNASLPNDLPTVPVNEGRNRAFSFEFFSFLDEAPSSSLFDGAATISASLPMEDDMPDPIMSTSLVGVDDDPRYDDDAQFHSHRPRGDSIIFDPVSFQDGGIHETNALAKVRSESVASSNLSLASQAGIMPSVVPSSTMTTAVGSNDSTYNLHVPDAPKSSMYPTTSTVSSQQAQASPDLPPISMNANTVTPHVTTSSTTCAAITSAVPSVSTASPFPMELLNKDGRIGIYLPDARRARIARFHSKRKLRIWRKRIKYDCRKKLADSRPRIKGRFVKRSDLDDEE